MQTQEPTPLPSSADRSAGSFRALVHDAFRFWEFRRLFYNLALLVVVLAWLTVTWPHFRPMFSFNSLLLLFVLGLVANVCYCAAYLVDIPMQLSSIGGVWRSRRWLLWAAGTLLAIVLANYWIVDEIYPFVR